MTDPFHFLVQTSLIPKAGVGCFSVSHIAKGSELRPKRKENFRRLTLEEIPDEFLKFCILLSSGHFLSPEDFLRMGVFWYINHAREPNVEFTCGRLRARHNIKPGDELTLYYSDLLTHPKNLTWVRPEHVRKKNRRDTA